MRIYIGFGNETCCKFCDGGSYGEEFLLLSLFEVKILSDFLLLLVFVSFLSRVKTTLFASLPVIRWNSCAYV
jgi:hypothetical protein